MEETRVKKYSEYRNSFIKENAISSDNIKKVENVNLDNTVTSSLHIKEVLEDIDLKDKEVTENKRQNFKKIWPYILIGLGCLVVVAAVIVFAILGWSK